MKRLEVILKTVERCNINCTYCYFFNGLDTSYLKHPKYISIKTIEKVASFIALGCKERHYKKVRFDFHGGEPMMQKKSEFDAMCHILKNTVESSAEVEFNMQTNATLVTDTWIDLLSKHKVNIGVSIDGTKEINDEFRVDHKGNGTYERTCEGISMLQEAVQNNKLARIASLCVINPIHSAKKIYRHFVDDLKLDAMDFLLPDFNHETMEQHTNQTGLTAADYGRFLCDLFDEWTGDDNPKIAIRILRSAISLLTGGISYLLNFGPADGSLEAITIASNGDVSPDDTLRSANPDLLKPIVNVENSSLEEYFHSPQIKQLDQSLRAAPSKCTSCLWENVCHGGMPVHRYNQLNHFNNPSVMCMGLKSLYSRVMEYILLKGFPAERIKNVLIQ